MARGFNTTFGVGATDLISTTLSTDSTLRSWFCWMYLKTNTVCIPWVQRTGAGSSAVEFYTNNDSTYHFHRTWSSIAGEWSVTAPSLNAWHAVGVSYDGSSASNNPIFYLDQTKPSVTLVSQSVGTLTNMAGVAYYLGDLSSGGAVWDGMLADFAVWNAILTDGEFFALAKGIRPYNIRPGSLAGYWPLDGIQSPEPDLSGNKNNGTLTGTKGQPGPPTDFFTPQWPVNWQIAAAAPTNVFRKTASRIGTRAGTRQTWAV